MFDRQPQSTLINMFLERRLLEAKNSDVCVCVWGGFTQIQQTLQLTVFPKRLRTRNHISGNHHRGRKPPCMEAHSKAFDFLLRKPLWLNARYLWKY